MPRGCNARETDLANGKKPNVKRALDALNFFLADVRDGLGPYLAIYLLTEQKWDAASIGMVRPYSKGNSRAPNPQS